MLAISQMPMTRIGRGERKVTQNYIAEKVVQWKELSGYLPGDTVGRRLPAALKRALTGIYRFDYEHCKALFDDYFETMRHLLEENYNPDTSDAAMEETDPSSWSGSEEGKRQQLNRIEMDELVFMPTYLRKIGFPFTLIPIRDQQESYLADHLLDGLQRIRLTTSPHVQALNEGRFSVPDGWNKEIRKKDRQS